MNCASARNRILALPDPAVPTDSLSAHLDGCPACQTWHRISVQMDRAIAAIPVPADSGDVKRKLLAQFQTTETPATKPKSKVRKSTKIIKMAPPTMATVRPAQPKQPLGERFARMWPAGLVAAAVLVGAIVWATLGGKSNDNQLAASPGPDPMLRDVVAAKVKVDTAPNAVARVEALAGLADTLHDEARTLAKVSPGDEMTSLAKMYEQVVRDALVPQARALSDDEKRTKLLAVKEKLEKAEQEANKSAAEAPVGSDRPLKDIAEAAKAGRIELAKLIQGSAI